MPAGEIIGPDQGVWGQAANWDINEVPANSQTEQFRVEIENLDQGNKAVNFNLQSPTKINRLFLDRARLNMPTGSNLQITQAATINGWGDESLLHYNVCMVKNENRGI